MPRVKATIATDVKNVVAVIAPFGRGGYSGYTTVPKVLIGKKVLVKAISPANKKEKLEPIERMVVAFGDKGAAIIMPAIWKDVKVEITPVSKEEEK